MKKDILWDQMKDNVGRVYTTYTDTYGDLKDRLLLF